jgi:glutamate synthase domain-containing protein 2
VSKDSDQTETAPRKFKLGPLGSLNQVTKGLAKTIRAMADGTLDSQVGARICNGLGIMRACLETQKLEQLEARMDEIADRVARDRTNAARERNSTHEAQRLSN